MADTFMVDSKSSSTASSETPNKFWIARAVHYRSIASVSLYVCAGIAFLFSFLYTVFLIAVPIFGLENDNWIRSDNPVVLSNVLLCLFVSVVCIFAARSSNRTRFWLGFVGAVFVLGLEIYINGFFG